MRQIVLVCTFCYYSLVTNKQKAGTSPTKVWFPASTPNVQTMSVCFRQGYAPQDRYFSEPNLFHRLSEEQIGHCFLLEIERKVLADSVITIDQTEYEVDCRFAKQRIKLRYSADLKDLFAVEADGTLSPIRLLNKKENAFVKREKVHLCRGEEPTYKKPDNFPDHPGRNNPSFHRKIGRLQSSS